MRRAPVAIRAAASRNGPGRSGMIREQPRPVGPLGELAVLVGSETRGEEIARLTRLTDGDDEAVARG